MKAARRESGAVRVLLAGNYPPDRQESMLRFGRELASGLEAAGAVVERAAPEPVLNRFARGPLAKWLGHADKYLLFPRKFAGAVRRFYAGGPGVVHILDHSNAVYGPACGRRPWLVTCHDLIAVRSARGEFGPERRPRATGRALQRRIAQALAAAPFVACDSDATAADFLRVIGRPAGGPPRAIYLGINRQFTTDGERDRAGEGAVLHAGSGAWYKRRDRVLRIFARIRQARPGAELVIIGEPLDAGCRALARSLGVAGAVRELGRVSDARMAALFRAGGVLLFPSEIEGFGWPPLEAMACGCPVVCSNGGSLAEVAGGPLAAALDGSREGDEAFAAAALRFLALDPAERPRLAAEQSRILARFSWERCAADYLDFCREILETEQK